DGHGATSKRARNLYGMQMARSTFEGTKALMDQRPFVLTRSGFAGVQRYSAVWTGDNVASEEHMLLGVRLVNSLGLSGVAFSGYDIGGFFGDSSASLFARWISIGTFAPLFRVHSMVNSRDSEPWSYGEEVEKIARNYIKLRYALMPYIYSLFREAYLTNMPVTRSLAIDFTHDPHIYHPSYQNQFLFGPFIMVAPIESSEAYCPVYLPKGGWYNLHSGKFYDGGQKIVMESPLAKLPILVKSGAIIPMQTVVQTTAEAPEGTLYLHIYHGTTASTFTYYEDDGESYHFQNGAYYSREIRYAGRTVTFGTVEGQYKTQFSKICLMLHGFKTKKEITADGKKVKLKSNGYRFTTPIEKVDPLASDGGDDIETVLYGNFKWSNHKMIIKL
ncbi:MAG: DUF5110 domain-containing protein, partial [Bacteroidetes bacterium]|nr:DUF5110 domain-containing protein [Bacteroidota bacterium]